MENGSEIPPSKHSLPKLFLLFLFVLGFLSTFAGGYFLNYFLSFETESVPTEKPKPVVDSPDATGPEDPGEQYFEDTVMLVSKSAPHTTLAATVSRKGKNQFVQRGRVSYFDGTEWKRETESKTTSSQKISGNEIVRDWSTEIDPSRVLRESSKGTVVIADTQLVFDTGSLTNEIGMRSLPGYTKFISTGEGTLTVDGQRLPAYVLYTHIYSLDASQIQVYDTPLGLTTDWISFWDMDGNFYHIDKTEVGKPTGVYKTHSIGVYKSKDGSVTKTFDIDVQRDAEVPPVSYRADLGYPVSKTLLLSATHSFNKYPGSSYNWFFSLAEGVGDINGVGMIEFIKN